MILFILTALLLAPLIPPSNRGPREFLFDLEADPGEKQNLLARHPGIASRLRDHLKTWGADLQPPGVESDQLSRAASYYFDYYLDGKPAVTTAPSVSPEDAAARHERRKQRRDGQDPK